jgi:hypothetical protein
MPATLDLSSLFKYFDVAPVTDRVHTPATKLCMRDSRWSLVSHGADWRNREGSCLKPASAIRIAFIILLAGACLSVEAGTTHSFT